jgi:glutathione S-transferase
MKSEADDRTRAEDLALYMSPTCGYCRRVMATLDSLGLEVEHRNIRANPVYRQELVEARGRPTVPVLRIASSEPEADDEWMPESADIEQYLADRFGDGTVPPRGLHYYLTNWRYVVIMVGVALAIARAAGCF